MRWVESAVQSPRYRAPMARALSRSSPRKGFWKPLSTTTTPSRTRLSGTGSEAPARGLGFGLGSDLGRLSLFLSGFFCAEAADGAQEEEEENRDEKKE